MGCCKPDREGLRVVQLLVVLAYRSLVELGCDFAPSSDRFSLLWSEMFIARQPINIPLRRSGMCYARTSRRSATRRLGISFSSNSVAISLLSSDVFSLLWSEIFIARQPINIPLRRSGMCYFPALALGRFAPYFE